MLGGKKWTEFQLPNRTHDFPLPLSPFLSSSSLSISFPLFPYLSYLPFSSPLLCSPLLSVSYYWRLLPTLPPLVPFLLHLLFRSCTSSPYPPLISGPLCLPYRPLPLKLCLLFLLVSHLLFTPPFALTHPLPSLSILPFLSTSWSKWKNMGELTLLPVCIRQDGTRLEHVYFL